MSESGTGLEIYNLQDGREIDLERIRATVVKALPLCLERALSEGDVLSGLDEVEVSIIDDEAIGKVHGEFLDDSTPTDVITFDHGEILVSADTAARRSSEFDNEPDREIALYVIHGLLHLAGYRDKSDAEFEQMSTAQESVLKQVW